MSNLNLSSAISQARKVLGSAIAQASKVLNDATPSGRLYTPFTVVVGTFLYRRPDGTSLYHQPDGVSVYYRP